ncbi:hypothetical protein FA95DRAFT_1568020 [Auriscalpium vulgare]|uniref:Uncharacterized protein n=1 Tax=Auriscalpium vulgare TaxID=40419 RepID=A0ACB8R2U3_9AGAM|nr:hypothetical protein FA95DRAFT_1568020 [Auriscalpium vulgare]
MLNLPLPPGRTFLKCDLLIWWLQRGSFPRRATFAHRRCARARAQRGNSAVRHAQLAARLIRLPERGVAHLARIPQLGVAHLSTSYAPQRKHRGQRAEDEEQAGEQRCLRGEAVLQGQGGARGISPIDRSKTVRGWKPRRRPPCHSASRAASPPGRARSPSTAPRTPPPAARTCVFT